MSVSKQGYEAWKKENGKDTKKHTGGVSKNGYEEWKEKHRESSNSREETKKQIWLNKNGRAVTNTILAGLKSWGERSDALASDYTSRFSSRKGTYEDSFVGDAAGWLESATGRKNEIETEASNIRGLLQKYGQYLDGDWVNSINTTLNTGDSNIGNILKAASQDVDYWAQWDSEDSYNEWAKGQKDYADMAAYDLEQGKADIAALEAQLQEYMDAYYGMSYAHDNWRENRDKVDALEEQYGQSMKSLMKALEREISEKKAYGQQAQWLQEGIRLGSVSDPTSEYYDPAFGKYAGAGAWKGLTLAELKQLEQDYQDAMEAPFTNPQNASENVERLESLKAQYGSIEDVRAAIDEYAHMTDEEALVYNYYLEKDKLEGTNLAEKYRGSLNLDAREGQEIYENSLKGNTLQRLLYQFNVGWDQFKSGIKGLGKFFGGKEEYTPPSAVQVAGALAREDLGDVDLKWYNFADGQWEDQKIFGNSLGQVAADSFSTTANMAPSIITSSVIGLLNPTAGAAAGSLLLGASASGNAYQEMVNLGYSKEQAGSYAALVGASEAGLQYLLGGIGKLGGVASGNTVAKIAGSIDNAFLRVSAKLGGKMLSEGLEEGLQEILTPWFKNLTLHTDENVNWNDVAYSGLLGAITAFVFEGKSTISSDIKASKTGKELISAGVTGADVKSLAGKFSAGTETYKLNQMATENMNAYQMGEMFRSIGAELTAQNKADITRSLVSKGMDEKHAALHADVFEYIADGGELSGIQLAMIEKNDVLAQTLQETVFDPMSGRNQRTAAYNTIAQKLSGKGAGTATATAEAAGTSGAETVTTPAKSGAETSAEVSKDGVMHIKSTGKEIKIHHIEKVSGKEMTFATADGKTVRADDVQYASEEEALLYESMKGVENITVNAANAIVQAYKPGQDSVGSYVMDMAQAYKAGYYGYPVSSLAENGSIDPRMQIVYDAGKTAAGKAVAKAQAAVRKTAAGEKPTAGKVHFDGDRKQLTERQRASLSGMETVAQALGVQIYVFESPVDASGKHTGANGWYDPKNGSIHIDLHAGTSGEATMLFTLAHELTHFIRQWSPAKFKVLANFLMQEYGKQGTDVDALVQAQIDKAKRNGRTLSYAAAYEEMAADSMETMLADGKIVEKLAKLKAQDKSLWQKIKDFISELAVKIRKVYEGLAPDSAEGRYVAEMKDTVERLQELFAEGLTDASDNYATGIQKSTTEDGGVKQQARQGGYGGIREIFAKKGLDELSKKYGNKFPLSADFDQAMKADQTPLTMHTVKAKQVTYNKNLSIYKAARNAFVTAYGVKTSVHIQQMGIDVSLYADMAKESISKAVGKPNEQSTLDAIPQIKDILSDSVLMGIERIAHTDKKGTALYGYRLYNFYWYDDGQKKSPNCLVCTVVQSTDSAEGYVFHNIENVTVKQGLPGNNTGMPPSLNGNTYTVAQLYKTVKKIDRENGGLKYTDAEKDKYLFAYKERNDGVKYSNRDYSYKALTSKPDMVVTEVDDNVPKNRADIVAMAKKNAASVGRFDTQTGSVSVYIGDIGKDVIIGTSGLKHGLEGRRTENAIVTLKAGKILQNSIRINELTPKKGNADGSYVLIGAARSSNGDLYIVRSVVNTFKHELMSMDVLYAINAKKGNRLRSMRPGFQGPVTDSTISIAELLDYVNQYFPDVLPEEALKHYGHDSRPEGGLGEDVLYSDRDSESVSNRSLLANALEGVAQTEGEKYWLAKYKERIAQLDEQEAILRKLNAEIRELSFSKGKRDTAKLRQLRDEATKTANRINLHDKKLLELEASKALKDVLAREKAKAYKRAEQKGKEAVKAAKEDAKKKQQEIVERYQASRAKGVESRRKTEMRHKIQKTVKKLNDLLEHESKDKHIPSGLKKAVAAALEAVDMTASERSDHSEKFAERTRVLKSVYEDIRKSTDPVLVNAYDEVIAAKIEEVVDIAEDTPLYRMSLAQLEAVYDMYRMIAKAVTESNKAFKTARGETISQLGAAVGNEVTAAGGSKTHSAVALEGLKKFNWNNLKPVYAFERIGSKTFTELFNNVRKGEDVWAVDVTEARKFYLEQSEKFGYDGWDMEKRYDFHSTTGKDFRLTLAQIMSLYAYSKREQAGEHLQKGGFVFDSSIEVVEKKHGIPIKYKVNTASAYNLSPEILEEITGTLTQEQTDFVDAMQDYLSTVMGEKGNEVSMALYDVRLFKEKHYFPLRSAKQYLFEKNEVAGELRLKNSGFSKKTQPHASNPVILGNFMDVWANHVNDMSMYHAFVLPLEDFNRVYNFQSKNQEDTDSESVKSRIQNAYGAQANDYIKQLITDLNGGAVTDPREAPAKNLMGKFKKAAVFASASVVVQQPSAIGRALALVDLKHFLGPKVDHKRHKYLWAELKQYAPVAIIKEMGYFDTNMGRSTQDFIQAKEYKGIKEKAKALVTDGDFRDEAISRLPALADELTWCSIWEAVKRETRSRKPEMDVTSEAFLKLAGERFTEVITKTQVYDSVLSRSGNMRSKGLFMNMWTAFMAEPTTAINMIEDALVKARRGDKKGAGRAVRAVWVSVLLNSALVSMVYAARDDDEDETFIEKYLSSFTTEMLDGLNPATYYPFMKDIWSALQGFDIERSDMSLITNLTDTMQKLVKAYASDSGDKAGAWWSLADDITSLMGIPFKNIRRDVNGAFNVVGTIGKDWTVRDTTWGSLADTLQASANNAIPILGWLPDETKADKLYAAIIRGDSEYVSRIHSTYETELAYEAALRKGLREHDRRIRQAAEALLDGEPEKYGALLEEIIAEGNFTLETVKAAALAEYNALKPEDETEDEGGEKVTSIYTNAHYFTAILGGDEAAAAQIGKDLQAAMIANGQDEEEATEALESSVRSQSKKAYKAGNLTDEEVLRILTQYGGLDTEEAVSKAEWWAFQVDYPEYADLSEKRVQQWLDIIQPAEIDIAVYYDFIQRAQDCEGVDKNGDGKADSGTVKKQILALIRSMDLSYRQKKALKELYGYE